MSFAVVGSKEHNPPVTWLMAVRNGMPFLPRTLASLEAQTYPHFRILVWDNGSTDGTVEELHRWVPSRLPGVIYASNPMGLGASRAALVNAAETELCAWTDAEDLSHPERIAKQVAYLQSNPDAVLVGTQIDTIDDKDRPHSVPWEAPTDDAEVRWATRWTPKNLQPSWLFRRSKVIEAGNYRDNQPIEDHDLLIRLSLLGRLHNLSEPLLRYRRHSSSITASVQDHGRNYRECAALNGDILFPGLSSEKAMYVWDLVADLRSVKPARVSNLFLLNRSARMLAKSVGEDPSYFRKNACFVEQHFHLKRRVLETAGLGSVWRLRQRLAKA